MYYNSKDSYSTRKVINYLSLYLSASKTPRTCISSQCSPSSSKEFFTFGSSGYQKLYDNIAINSENIAIKRGVSAGYGILPNSTPDKSL